ncbi:hypothetical protein T4C_2706 [Trichinella pseudospiralis]|uniref:Uncharacterized protein n=1 Tax=Trichinella pseudospiralis TaxID=6337 RepID=A0A0V1GNP8_TRIPS|nr:hypothetical protein T4C_2706 [Trichinella pseudospiralis]
MIKGKDEMHVIKNHSGVDEASRYPEGIDGASRKTIRGRQ